MAALVLTLWAVDAPGDEIGFELGWCWSAQDFDCTGPYNYDTEEIKGARFGLFVEFDLNEHLAIDVGLHHVAMGMDYSWGLYTVENRVNYLSVPAVLRVRLAPESVGSSLYLSAGPRVDFLVSTDAAPWFESIYDEFARFGLGVDLGAGLELGWLRAEGRYSASFTDARPDESIYKITNRGQSIVFAFVLPLSKTPPE